MGEFAASARLRESSRLDMPTKRKFWTSDARPVKDGPPGLCLTVRISRLVIT
jgi:hypothetical protein